jgi:lipoprotein-anchoring transpeptidase ErfK/SrfK
MKPIQINIVREKMDLKRHLAPAIILALIASWLAHPALAQGGSTHMVQSGDTLYSIATRYGVDVNQLASSNGVASGGAIYPGQPLLIPAPATGFSGDALAPSYAPTTQPEPIFINTPWSYGAVPQATIAPVPYPLPPTGLIKPLPAAQQTSNAFYPSAYATPPASLAWPTGLETGYQTQPAYSPPVNQTQPAPIYSSLQPTLPVPTYNRSTPAPQPLLTKPASVERWIDVNLRTQTLVAYEGQTPVFRAWVSTGTYSYPTVTGTYSIYVKYESADMRGGASEEAYYLEDVPYVMYFYGGYGLHGAYWHNNFGRPMSHGCVNLSVPDAHWLFNWASVGTKVVTHP